MPLTRKKEQQNQILEFRRRWHAIRNDSAASRFTIDQAGEPVDETTDPALSRRGAHRVAGTDKTKKVSRNFEGVFLTNIFENMFEGLNEDGPFGSGSGNGVWRSLFTEEYAKSVAASGGIADQSQRQLISLQEKKQ